MIGFNLFNKKNFEQVCSENVESITPNDMGWGYIPKYTSKLLYDGKAIEQNNIFR